MAMKRSCITLSDDFCVDSHSLAMTVQAPLAWTMMVAVTLAVTVFGMIWYG